MAARAPDRSPATLFAGGGDMGRRIAAFDWSTSPVGPIDGWTDALVNTVSLMLPASAEIVLFWGPQFVAFYNDAYAPTIGDKHPRALGRPAEEAWTELWDDLHPLLSHVRDTGETYAAKDRPFYIERAGYGEEVYFDISYSAVREGDGSVGGVLCIVGETTERVRAARAVAEDRARLSQMFDQAPSFMAVLRQPGHRYDIVNQAYVDLIGGRDPTGSSVADVVPEAVAQGYIAILDEVAATGRPYRASGARFDVQVGDAVRTRFVDFVYQPVTDATGAVTSIFVDGTDVTERHQAQERLALSEETLRLATEAADIGTWDYDPATGRLEWSERTRAMFGLAGRRALTLGDMYDALHPEDRADTAAALEAALDPARRALYDVEYRVQDADGATRWIAAKGRGLFDEDGRCIRAVGTTIDITARKRMLDDLRESEQRFRQLADTAPALIWLTDAEGRIVFANQFFETMLGYTTEELRADGCSVLSPPGGAEAFEDRRLALAHAGEAWSGETSVTTRDGRTRWVHAEARPRFVDGVLRGFVGCAVDVTAAHAIQEDLERRVADRTRELTDEIAERRRVEATLAQMQRLEAVGQLTAGVAHDFNNLLTVVLGNVGMIERAGAGVLDAKSLTRLEHVRNAAQRGATLTGQLLAFARRARLEARAVNLNATLAGMRDLLQSSVGGAVAIETRLADDLWAALVDPTQIEMAVLNLAINARDAMPRGGQIVVTTANVTRGAPLADADPPAGDHVRVAIHDTGTGMDAATLTRVFEPFFTTKEVGKGSGLGLAQVFGFAKQSGGGVTIDTAPDEGTTVSIFLPRAAAVAREPVAVAAPPAAGVVAGRCVLVVDDDEQVRAVTAESLRMLGCTVIEAASGAGGLAALADTPGIELAVADFAMPGMNGAEFAGRARALRPGFPVIFVTGFADLSALADVPEADIVQKPFPDGEVARRVQAKLERRRRPRESRQSADE